MACQCALLASHGHHPGWLGDIVASFGHHFGWSGCTPEYQSGGQDIILVGLGAFRLAMGTILRGHDMILGGRDALWLALGTKKVPPGGRLEIQKKLNLRGEADE